MERLANALWWHVKNPHIIPEAEEVSRKRRYAYYVANKKRMDATTKRSYAQRLKTDPAFRLLNTLRARLNVALSKHQATKADRTMKLIGCSLSELSAHLESQFLPGMTWANRSQWHVDHIKPCSAFDLSDLEQQQQCFHFSNLRPLWARDNLRKSSKWNGKAMRKGRAVGG